jgi:hypothetical protein
MTTPLSPVIDHAASDGVWRRALERGAVRARSR